MSPFMAGLAAREGQNQQVAHGRRCTAAECRISIAGMSDGERKRWVVIGAHEGTGKLMAMTVQSATAERAEAVGRKNGILVSSVEPEGAPVPDYATPGGVETDNDVRAVRLADVSAGTSFKLGFF